LKCHRRHVQKDDLRTRIVFINLRLTWRIRQQLKLGKNVKRSCRGISGI